MYFYILKRQTVNSDLVCALLSFDKIYKVFTYEMFKLKGKAYLWFLKTFNCCDLIYKCKIMYS